MASPEKYQSHREKNEYLISVNFTERTEERCHPCRCGAFGLTFPAPSIRAWLPRDLKILYADLGLATYA